MKTEKGMRQKSKTQTTPAWQDSLFTALMEASHEAIFLLDDALMIRDISSVVTEILGYPDKKSLLDRLFTDLMIPEEVPGFTDSLNKSKSGKAAEATELTLVKHDGSSIMAGIRIIQATGSNPGENSSLVIAEDITKRKNMELLMIQNSRFLSLGEMASGIAHEVNQPLNNMSLTLENVFREILSMETGSKDYFKDKSERIFNNLFRMRGIIDHIRDFSKDHGQFFSATFDVVSSITSAVSMISAQFRHRSIELTEDFGNGIPPVSGNTYKFEQVILNLLVNSKDALDEKKEKLQDEFPMHVRIKVYRDGVSVVTEITDNGIGIEPGEIEKIRLPFYTTKALGKGTGMGLSISYGIVSEMNGTMEISSKPGEETTIVIKLPVSDEPVFGAN